MGKVFSVLFYPTAFLRISCLLLVFDGLRMNLSILFEILLLLLSFSSPSVTL